MSVAAVPPTPETVDVPDPAEEATPETETPAGAPAEGEQTTAEAPAAEPEAAAAPEIPEETLKAAAEKYATDAIKRANTTMAAARRAEARTEAVKAENARLTETITQQRGNLQYAADWIGRLQKGDVSALQEIGFGSFRDFANAVANHGEAKPETAEERIARLEKERADERTAAERQRQEAYVAEQQKLVFDHVAADKARWHYLSSARGRDELWDALGEYVKLHGRIDDAGVNAVADAVEAEFRAEFGAPPKPSAPRPGANNGASPAPTGRNPKVLAGKAGAAAPGGGELSMDPDERRKQVNALLKAQGQL